MIRYDVTTQDRQLLVRMIPLRGGNAAMAANRTTVQLPMASATSTINIHIRVKHINAVEIQKENAQQRPSVIPLVWSVDIMITTRSMPYAVLTTQS